MTAIATTAAILVLFDCSVFTTNVSAFAFEIIRMTGSTERDILGKSIGNDLAIIAMALDTTQVPAVVARIITGCTRGIGGAGTVIKLIRRCPAVCCMTGIALHGSSKMACSWLGSRAAASCMTGIAHTHRARIMNPGTTNEGGRGMT